jgi:hypothetical protein
LTLHDFLTNSSYTLKDLENNEQDWTEEQMHLDNVMVAFCFTKLIVENNTNEWPNTAHTMIVNI